ncbi:hypothetical protein [Actinoplanes sp. RD1]|uniref:hypothetical protein n=1 Tax=Actinoplanes sp. RD1 TaxID=3064538 RepID=UPI002741140D|nr:hypothetical protein [Actinoplanes sp. RD1]
MSSRLLDRFLALLGGRPVEARRRRILERESTEPPASPGVFSHGEIGVLVDVDQTLAAGDRKLVRRVVRQLRGLVRAAREADLAWQRLQELTVDPRWAAHRRRRAAEAEAPAESSRPDRTRRAGFSEDFDPHVALVSARVLLAVEIVFVVVEFFFWYGVFAFGVSPRASLLDPSRLSAVLLALAVPVAGLLAARVLGALGHRAIMNHPGTGRRERIGAVAAAVVAVLAVVGVTTLVYFRFGESAPLGTVEIPAGPMAVIFAVILLGDMVARIFLPSEIRQQTRLRSADLEKAARAAITRNYAHVDAWLSTRARTQAALDTAERVTTVGGLLIADSRSRTGAPPVAAAIGQPRTGHAAPAPAPDRHGRMTLAVPDTTLLRLFGGPLGIGPTRVLRDAVDALDRLRPRDPDRLGELIEAMRRDLHGHPATEASPPVPILPLAGNTPTGAQTPPAPVNGHHARQPSGLTVGDDDA